MGAMSSAANIDVINIAWKAFVEQGINPEQRIRPVIARSWLRSRKIIDPSNLNLYMLPSDVLDSLRQDYDDILALAESVMKDICAISGNSFVAFCDTDGYVLKTISNVDYPDPIGVACSEGYIGTNAVGIALIEGSPIEIKGHEHYSVRYHNYSCAAVPLHDPHGKIIGVIDVTNPFGDLPDGVKEALQLGVKVIENQLNTNYERYKFKEAQQSITAVLDLLENCCLVLDKKGKIINANGKVLELLNTDHARLLGKHSRDLFCNPEKFLSAIRTNNNDAEYKFKIKWEGKVFPCVLLGKKNMLNEGESFALTFHAETATVGTYTNKQDSLRSGEFISSQSKVWKNIERIARRAGPVYSHVLLEGESGTGKEVIARLIHRESGRGGAFVPINCGAIPKELLQSELFGYEEGAFTGARKGGQTGKIEIANHGTLFLDEIGEMPLDMQVSLLRFLQDRIITRVGSHIEKVVDVRIIAATNRDIESEVAKGNFREDLYYRLNVVNFKLPPLRERKEDIPIFAKWFLAKYCEQCKADIANIDAKAMVLLCKYDWPGNIRELANVIESAVVFAEGNSISVTCLPSRIIEFRHNSRIAPKELKEYEKVLIKEALNSCGGNISKTAKTLGIARNTLYRKMAQMGICN